MQITLTTADLAAMPPRLRQELLDHVATRRKTQSNTPRQAAAVERLAALDHKQAISLLRSVSFGQRAQALHDLLRALAYGKDAEAPSREDLMRLLQVDDPRDLARRLAVIGRRARAVTHRSGPIARYVRSRAAYVVHPRTRASLRDVFGELVRPGVGEEPPWA